MKIQDKVFVVTGGGSGIGRALVLQILENGGRVAAVDINSETLEETRALAGSQNGFISTHIANVTDRDAVEELAEQVIDKHGAVDGLINNAGIIQPFVKINELDYDTIDQVLNVNLYGHIYMTKAFLPKLLLRDEAHIVNISSMGGFFPVPGQTMYGASKAAVKLFTEGLYSELLETNVRVTAVFPGAIDTKITENSGVEFDLKGTDLEKIADKFAPVAPKNAAKIILDGMQKNKFQVYVGVDSRFMNFFYRLHPRLATKFMFNQMKILLEI